MATTPKKCNQVTIKIKKAEYKNLNAATIKIKQADYNKLNAATIEIKKAAHYKINAATIKIKQADYDKINAATIKIKRQASYKAKAGKFKASYKAKAGKIKDKYHTQKHRKQDAADKLREQGPRARKTLSRSAIKKKVRERFKFGKNFIEVKDCNGDWTRVFGPCWHRVYRHQRRQAHQAGVDETILWQESLASAGRCFFAVIACALRD